MKQIMVENMVGSSLNAEDAIILKGAIKESISEEIVLDFNNVGQVNCSFFSNLLTDLIYTYGREYVMSKIKVKNLSNYKNYERVVLGTGC